MNLEQFFTEYPKVALGFSGGVDSAYLLYAASKYAKEVRAYYVKSAFQPAFELEDARKLADEIGADMKVIHVDVLRDEQVAANPSDRCYYCKRKDLPYFRLLISTLALLQFHKDAPRCVSAWASSPNSRQRCCLTHRRCLIMFNSNIQDAMDKSMGFGVRFWLQQCWEAQWQ